MLVVAVTAKPDGAAGTAGLPVAVVAVTVAECADSPAVLVAVTLNVYWVPADRPVTVAAVPVTDATIVVPRYTLYPVAPAEPIHDSDTLVDVVPVTVSAVGAAGVVTVPPGPVSVTSSANYVPWAYQPCR